jgi:hypothetical protein
LPSDISLTRLPESMRAELDALAVRRPSKSGEWRWRHVSRARPERLEVLLHQPVASRIATDWDHLAQAALAAGRPEVALRYLEDGIQAAGMDVRGFEGELRRLEPLLGLGREPVATTVARSLADGPGATPDRIAALAEVLAKFDQKPAADDLFARAALAPRLTAEQRYQFARRRAALHAGLPRWRILLRAVDELPVGSPLWNAGLDDVLRELTGPAHAELAGQLAEGAQSQQLRARLRLRQAFLLRDPNQSADILWELHQAGDLSSDQLDWACPQLLHVGHCERVIAILEAQMRKGQRMSRSLFLALALAYDSTGRRSDGERARTSLANTR